MLIKAKNPTNYGTLQRDVSFLRETNVLLREINPDL